MRMPDKLSTKKMAGDHPRHLTDPRLQAIRGCCLMPENDSEQTISQILQRAAFDSSSILLSCYYVYKKVRRCLVVGVYFWHITLFVRPVGRMSCPINGDPPPSADD